MPVVTVTQQSRTSIISINRPDERNAITHEVIVELEAAFREFDASDQRCAILTGTGEHFSMGSDPTMPVTELWRCMPTLGVRTEKPIIAAVSGLCAGSAFSLNMMADLSVATEDASFRYPEGTHGATGGLVASLAVRIPHKSAMEVMLLGLPISGAEAYRMGFVNRACAPGQHVESALEMAEVIGTRAPMVLALMKRFVTDHVLPLGPSEIQARTLRQLTEVRGSNDSAEGKRAMAEGRTPSFQGN